MKQELIDLATYVTEKNPCIHLNNLLELFNEFDKINSKALDKIPNVIDNEKPEKACSHVWAIEIAEEDYRVCIRCGLEDR